METGQSDAPSQSAVRSPDFASINILGLLLPGPLQRQGGQQLLLSILKDYFLITLNWTLVGHIWLQVHAAPWNFSLFYGLLRTWSIPPTLLGIALVHGALITSLRYAEGPEDVRADSSMHMWAMGKPVLLATLVLGAAFRLEWSSALAVIPVWSAGALHFITLLGWRWAEVKCRRRDARTREGMRNVLIVGAGGIGRRIASDIEKHPELKRVVCGFLDDRKLPRNGVIGRTSDLAKLARAGFVDEVILAAPHERELTLRVLRTARQLRLDVKISPDLFGCRPMPETEHIGCNPLISLHQERLPIAALFLKRALDVVIAGAALILMAPALALLAILIRLDSPGPTLYVAARAGRKGMPFRCFKFRTMVKDAEALKEGLRKRNQRQGPFFKIAHDPRITRVGRILRRYSLDELPQLWNVLQGQMSLVGPRPHPLDDFSGYAIEHLSRLDVTPGMTGLWQVTARRNPSFQSGMNLDVEYIQRWSLGMDFRILLKTAAVVLRGGGD